MRLARKRLGRASAPGCAISLGTAREILQAALALPEDERVMLIEELEASLPIEKDEEEFIAMLDERAAAAAAGEPGTPGEEVFERLLAK